MTNNEVKAFLRQYRTCMAKAQRLKADMEIFTASAKSIKGEFDECINRSAKIEKLISSHKNYLEREILIRKYIYGDTTEEIAERLKTVKLPDHPAEGVMNAYRAMAQGADKGALWLYRK